MRVEDDTPMRERWIENYNSKSRMKEGDKRVKDEVRNRVMKKDVNCEKRREKERDTERRDQGKEKEQEQRREKDLEKAGDRGRDTDRGREKIRDNDKGREKERDRGKDKERKKQKDREREKDNGRNRFKEADERDKGKEKNREKEKQISQEKDRARDRGRSDRRLKDGVRERSQGVEEDIVNYDHQSTKEVNIPDDENDSKILQCQQNADVELVAAVPLESSDMEKRISKMQGERLKKSSEAASERLKKSSEAASEVSSWVNRIRKIELKMISEKERALQLSKVFEEQDKMNDEGSDDEKITQHTSEDLGGVKILHGLDKVLEGGAVVLTLKDQNILADSGINQEVDMLENVEIGEQKRRDEAYWSAKKKTGVYDDKFNGEPGVPKKMLPQYDDPVIEEGVTLDSSGRFTGEAERKLEELRKRIQGFPTRNLSDNLNSIGKISTDYYTEEDMMKFKKPKKKKSLKKKEKLDIYALEAEAITSGLGAGDLGSRSDGRRQNLREKQERIEAEKRRNAYRSAYAKADEASKALRPEQINSIQTEEDDTFVFGDDDDELRKSLERARNIALEKQDDEEKSTPQVITLLATSTNDSPPDNSNHGSGDQQENMVVLTEMEEFVWGLLIDEDAQKSDQEDVFMEEHAVTDTSYQEIKDGDVDWAEVKETAEDVIPAKEEEEVVPDETIHESAVGKGLAGALKLLKDRGTLKETMEWCGRNMDKKETKLVGIYDNDGSKKILIERTDEYGRILTPKESFRLLSHKFHGKGPGKMKQEKRMRRYQEELKVKQMKNSDTPSLSVERMREAQAKLHSPYLVLSGHVKLGRTIFPGSGFATVEKDLAGGLTPVLGNRKVENFLNIKRKPEPGDAAAQKKPKTLSETSGSHHVSAFELYSFTC